MAEIVIYSKERHPADKNFPKDSEGVTRSPEVRKARIVLSEQTIPPSLSS